MIHPFRPETEFEIEERCAIVEMVGSAVDPHCSIARARVKPGVETVLHRVNATVERYIILDGEAEVWVGEGPWQAVRPLDVVWIDAGVPQKIRNTSRERDLVFLCICTPGFRPAAYEGLA